MRDGYNFSALRNQFFETFDHQPAEFVNLKDFQDGLFPLAKELPGNDVRMMLRDRNDDLVSFVDKRLPETGRDQVDGHRGSGGEDDLLPAAGVQELLDGVPRLLVLLGRIDGELMDGPMDIGVGAGCKSPLLFQDSERALGRRRVVQIDKRLPIHLRLQGGELTPDFAYVHTSLISLQIYIFLYKLSF